MSRQAPLVSVVAAAILVVLMGCQPQEPFYLKHMDNEAQFWKGVATEIEVPDIDVERLADAANATPPPSLMNRKDREVWNLTLEEAIQIALKNNKVMRNIGGQVQGPPDFLLRNPEAIPTIYDPAIAESNPRSGHGGGAVGVRHPVQQQLDVGKARHAAERQPLVCLDLSQRKRK